MNNQDPINQPHWQDLVRRARADTPPSIDTAALLRAVRSEPLARPGWWTDLAGLFELPVSLRGSVAVCALLFAVAGWQAWDNWQTDLAWSQLVEDEHESTELNGADL